MLMRYNGEPSWVLGLDVPYMQLFALYVRDTLGLDSHGFPPIPPLFPAVPLYTASLPEKEKLCTMEHLVAATGKRKPSRLKGTGEK